MYNVFDYNNDNKWLNTLFSIEITNGSPSRTPLGPDAHVWTGIGRTPSVPVNHTALGHLIFDHSCGKSYSYTPEGSSLEFRKENDPVLSPLLAANVARNQYRDGGKFMQKKTNLTTSQRNDWIGNHRFVVSRNFEAAG